MRARRIALITTAVLATLAIALLVCAKVWLPREVTKRAVRGARERLGMQVSIGDVSVGMDGVTLERIAFTERAGGAVEGSIDRVEVELAWSALFKNEIEVTRISIGPGRINVLLEERALGQLFRRLRGSRGGGTARTASRSLPPLDLDRVELRVLDYEGLLATTVLQSMGGGSGGMQMSSSLLIAGDESSDRLEAHDLEITARRTDRIRLERVSASSLDVRWASSITGAEEAAEGRLVPRIRRAVRTLKRALRTAEDSEEEAEDDGTSSWTRRLAPGFVGQVDEMSITGPAVSGTDERFSLTSVRLTYDGHGKTRVSGAGSGARVGQASWDVTLEPERGRAEGRIALTEVPLSIVSPFVPSVPWYPSERGRVSVDAEMRAEGLDVVTFRGSVELRDAALSHPRIAAAPVHGLGIRIESEATIRPLLRRVSLRSARISLGEASVQWTGEVEVDPDHYLARGALVLPVTSCDAAVQAIPRDVLGPLTGFGLAGRIGGRVDVDIDSAALDRTRLDVIVDDQCTFVSAPAEADVSRFAGPFLHQALEPDGTVFEMETGPGSARWVPLYAMSPNIIEAVLAHEDAAYYRHHGFAPWAIRDAVVRNLTEGRYVVGASTITMQLAKNLFLRREKTLVRKIQEVLLAWWLERALDKERILELYLNVIEYGPSVYGIGAASRWWFGRSATALSPVEASLLAIILPSPKAYAGLRGARELPPGMKGRIARFLRHMAAERRLDQESLRYALEELEGYRFGGVGSAGVDDDAPLEDAGGGFGGEHYVPPDDWSSP